MNKRKIGIDLDDTSIAFVAGLCVYLNRVYGGALTHQHFTTWHIHEVIGCDEEEATRRVAEFCHSDDHKALDAITGAVESLQLLSAIFEPIAITARDAPHAPLMLPIVERHFGNLFTDVHFLGHHKSKGDMCVELGIHFMVDDGLHNADSVGTQGIRVYLMDQPWNQCDVLPPNTIRVYSWEDIVRLELGYNAPR